VLAGGSRGVALPFSFGIDEYRLIPQQRWDSGEVGLVAWLGLINSLRRCMVSGVGFMFLVQSLSVSAQASEAGLRVAFVYNFLKFIEWPNQGNELTLCAIGAQDAARQSLLQIDSKSTQKVTIRVLFVDEASELEQNVGRCHLIYVPVTGADIQLPRVMPEGVLLVVDDPKQEELRAGIVLTRTREDRIEFTINDSAIKQAGVKVSSQLLKLAKKPGGAS